MKIISNCDVIIILIIVIFGVISSGFVCYRSGYDKGLNENAINTIFKDNYEGQRFHYEGDIFIGANDNELKISFEDLDAIKR